MKQVLKELWKSFEYVCRIQVYFWLIYIILVQIAFSNSNKAVICSSILIIIIFGIYFKYINRIINKNKFDKLRFNILLFVVWVILSVVIGIFLQNIYASSFNTTYIIESFILCALAIIIEIINIITYIFNKKEE